MSQITPMSIYWFFTGVIMLLPHYINSLLLPKRQYAAIRITAGILISLAVAFVDPLFPMNFFSITLVHITGLMYLIWCCRLRPLMYLYYFIWGVVLYFIAEQLGAVIAAALNSYGDLPVMYVTKTLSSLLISLLELWIIRSIRRKGADTLNWKSVLLSFLLSCLVIYINMESFRGTEQRETFIFLFQLFSMMVVILALYLQVIIVYGNSRQNEAEFMKFLVRANKKDYEMKKEYIELLNQKYHDLKHELRALRQMDMETRNLKLDQLEKEIDGLHNLFRTGNEVLDTILNDKKRECEKAGILFTCSAHGREMEFLDLVDLNILLGNMIDNAIEAVASLPKEQRIIDLKIYTDKQFIRIREMNYYAGELLYSDDQLLSTKPQDGYHGFGTRSMKYIVERYNGEMIIDAQYPVFRLHVLIPIPGKSA